MLKEIKGDRQRDERIDIFSSPFGSLWEEENYFKAAALMKEKDVMPDVFLQRWNQQYELLKGREKEGGVGGTFVWENLMGDFGEEWKYYLTAANKTWFPRQEMWLVQHSTLLFPGACIKMQQMSSDRELIFSINLGILSDRAPSTHPSQSVIWWYIQPQLPSAPTPHSPTPPSPPLPPVFSCRRGHEEEVTSKRPISFSHPFSSRQPALSFFWQSCQSI